MADKKISALTAATTPLAGTEILPIVQSGATVNVAVSNLTAGRAISLGSSSQVTGSGILKLGVATGNAGAAVQILGWSSPSYPNWQIDSALTGAAGGLSFSPSTTGGGTTFTTPVMTLTGTGLNSTVIGATTPAAGSFTTLSASGGTSLATSSGTVGVGGAAGAQTLTVSKTSLTNPITIGAVSDSNTYGQLSFNGVFTAAGVLGINGGADANLYLNAPTGGTVQQKINNVKISEVSSTGLAVTGTLSATGVVTFSNYGAGAATFSASGVISSVSDETWKIKDGVPINPEVMLKKLQPGYWYYNAEKAPIYGADRQLGFYAQNVNYAIGFEAAPEPEVVTTKAEDGTEITTKKPWGYYDRSVLAVVVMSLQNALAKIELLESKVEALEKKG